MAKYGGYILYRATGVPPLKILETHLSPHSSCERQVLLTTVTDSVDC